MALTIQRGAPSPLPAGWVSDRRLYLTADKDRLVEEGDADAAYLFAAVGDLVTAEDVARYGLDMVPDDGEATEPPSKPARSRRKA